MTSPGFSVKLVKSVPVSLKEHPEINEAWLERQIVEDPTILGLGEVSVLETQRRQKKAGRLDLLLQDPVGEKRYELELMLGPTDESHVIRTIEYWDIERRRYPAYDHYAVIIAENITSRFLNVISLFSGSIPIIAIQVNAFQVEDQLVLNFVTVLDCTDLRTDEETEAKVKASDRQDWASRTSSMNLELVDKSLNIINETASPQRTLNYNKAFIGLSDGVRSGNFVTFSPRKAAVNLRVIADPVQPWIKRLEDAGIDAVASRSGRGIKFALTPKTFDQNKELMAELFRAAVSQYDKQ